MRMEFTIGLDAEGSRLLRDALSEQWTRVVDTLAYVSQPHPGGLPLPDGVDLMRVDILSVDGSYVIGQGTVLGQLGHPADPNVRSCQAPDLPYVVQEDRCASGVLTLFHGSRLCPCGTMVTLTDFDSRW